MSTVSDEPPHDELPNDRRDVDTNDDAAAAGRAADVSSSSEAPAPSAPVRAERIVVGVDGGGSKTRALVAHSDGRTLATADGPGSALRPGGVSHAADVIAACVRDALRTLGEHATPAALVAGVAGAGREPERATLSDALTARGLAASVAVTTDAAIALDDAFGEGPGILLIAGTGSIAYGRAPDGRFERCGGWGPVLGDEGGGAWLGRRALNVAAAAADGREPDTALLPALLGAIDGDAPTAMIAWAARATPADFATLAPVVLRVAADGDLRANSVLALGVEELVLHVRTLARALFVDERAAVPLAFAGGLLVRGTALRRRLEHRLKTAVPGAQLRQADVEPERGAVRGALRMLGIELTPT